MKTKPGQPRLLHCFRRRSKCSGRFWRDAPVPLSSTQMFIRLPESDPYFIKDWFKLVPKTIVKIKSGPSRGQPTAFAYSKEVFIDEMITEVNAS